MWRSILVELPPLSVAGQDQIAAAEFLNLQTDIIHGDETERLFCGQRIGSQPLDGVEPHEQAVTRLLEIAGDSPQTDVLDKDQGPREADKLRVGIDKTPLPPQIAGPVAFGAGCEKAKARSKEQDC